MSQSGFAHVSHLAQVNRITADLPNSPLLRGEAVPIMPGQEISVRPDLAYPELDTQLRAVLDPAITLVRFILAKRKHTLIVGDPLGGLPAWDISGAGVRAALTPAIVKTGKLTKLKAEVVAADELQLNQRTQDALFGESIEFPNVSDSTLALRVSGRLGGVSVACAIGMRARYVAALPSRAFLAGKVRSVPRVMRSATRTAAELAAEAELRRQWNTAHSPYKGGVETNRRRH